MSDTPQYKEHFVIQQDQDGNLSVIADCDDYDAARSGIGVVNYVVSTIHVSDRTKVLRSDIAEECAKLMLEITSNRSTSSPQCIPVALYRKMEKLASQFKQATSE